MTRIKSSHVLIPPKTLSAEVPASQAVLEFVEKTRIEIEAILSGNSKKKFLVIGPCSIHNIDDAKEYALKLKELSEKVSDTFLILMRSYFEKPRTISGWQGLITDPHLNNSFEIETGLQMAREFLVWLAKHEIPAAVEFLNPIVPQYIADLVSWATVGARTTESQTHRQMASGVSMPVGFKNSTDGNTDIAIHAIQSASHPHHFVGVNDDGQVCDFKTKGNHFGHLILRGGKGIQNYDPVSVAEAQAALKHASVSQKVCIDCSHDNSKKTPELQPVAFEGVIDQIVDGNSDIVGIMLESNLFEGNQNMADIPLKKGVSITDKCISWDTTESLIVRAHTRMHN